MSIIEILLIAVGLSMDAFAVSVCKGLAMRKINWKRALIIGGAFGLAQAIMPLLGWLLGSGFSLYIDRYDHWIAFVLLVFIGVKMAAEAVREIKKEGNDPETEDRKDESLNIRELILLAVATSIDALAVGISFAFLKVNIWSSSLIIGLTTFLICVFGVAAGNMFGSRYKSKAELAGGIILILIGVKILAEGLGFKLF